MQNNCAFFKKKINPVVQVSFKDFSNFSSGGKNGRVKQIIDFGSGHYGEHFHKIILNFSSGSNVIKKKNLVDILFS